MRSTPPAGSPRRLAAAALLACAAGALTGCSFFTDLGPQTCEQSELVADYTDGAVTDGVYMTASWNEEWLWFPGRQRYRIHHGLGGTPSTLQAFLSFNRFGPRPPEDGFLGFIGNFEVQETDEDSDGDTNSVALASGNQAEFKAINETELIVVNGSCSDYYLLVVAGDPVATPDAGAE